MRNGQNSRRNRGRNNRGSGGMPMGQQGGGGGGGGNRNDARVRGNAHQLHEKYKNLSRDAASAGDRILAEYYMQHADHYFRVLNEMRPERPRDEQRRPGNPGDDAMDGDDGDDADISVQPQGFGANAAAGTFGVSTGSNDENGGASHRGNDDDRGNDDGGEDGADDAGQDAGSGDMAEAADAQGAKRPRGRGRGRGRPRRNAEADDAQPVDA